MGILVSSRASRLNCDHSGCDTLSRYIQGENDGQKNIQEKLTDWRCTSNGRTYCPEHAWKILGEKS